jgi:hypothetical protein
MPAKKRKTARKAKSTYVCVPCGAEIAVTKEGMGTSTLMCCGQVMKRKAKKN